MPPHRSKEHDPERVPKIAGFDVEVAAINPEAPHDRGVRTCRRILANIQGLPAGYRTNWAQDSGRIFLKETGASAYIDMDHLELAGPECRSAWDFTAAFHGMLNLVRGATRSLNRDLDEAARIRVHANNSDGHGNSWGGHNSFLLSRTTHDRIFHERLHYLLFLASAQISSMLLTGSGKVSSENEAPAVPFQISQRADFFECLESVNTTFRRPLVNSRDESLAESGRLARLHCIFFDTTLCHTSIVLRIGFMQLILAMIEAGQIDPSLIFDDPLYAVHAFSHDPGLQATSRILSGQQVTILEHQWMLLEQATRFVDRGAAEDVVPRAPEILELWGDTLEQFSAQKWEGLSGKIEWVTKKLVLDKAANARGLEWPSPELKLLDHLWSDLESGLYRALEEGGATSPCVTPEDIRRAQTHPPVDTRAFARSRLLREFEDDLVSIDWDSLILRRGGRRIQVRLPDPGRNTRDDLREMESLRGDPLLEALGAGAAPSPSYRYYSWPPKAAS